MADDGSQYPRVPTRVRDWEELNRRVAGFSGNVLARLEQIERDFAAHTIPNPQDPPVGNPHSQYMFWRGLWAPGAYEPHETVKDGNWTMVCTNPTTDRAAPQPSGLSYWYSGLGDTPTWNNDSDNATLVTTGQRYTVAAQAVLLHGIRVWLPVVDPSQVYQVYSVEAPSTTPVVSRLLNDFVAPAVGWFDVPVSTSILSTGFEFDLVLMTNSSAIPTTIVRNYDYRQRPAAPAAGEITHNNDNVTFRVNYLDSDVVDNTAFLQGMTVGDTIIGLGITWTIVSAQSNVADAQFEVSPGVREPEGVQPFTFSQTGVASVPTVSITDHYLGDPLAQGRKGVDTLINPVLDADAYGVDAFVQNATFSPDWAVVAYNG